MGITMSVIFFGGKHSFCMLESSLDKSAKIAINDPTQTDPATHKGLSNFLYKKVHRHRGLATLPFISFVAV